MRDFPWRTYLPLVVLIVAQALLVVAAPSRAPTSPEIAAGVDQVAPAQGGAGGGTAAAGATDEPTASPSGPGSVTATSAPGTGGGTVAPGTGSTPTGGATGGGTGGATGGGTGGGGDGGTGGSAPPGDTSHCTPDGRQTDIVYHAPPCVPRWGGGDNGGATYRGVTADSIKVLVFQEQRNEAVSQILAAEGLRETRANEDVFTQAAEDFLNAHYEFYGRKLDLKPFPAPRCPETPPDVAACIEEARRAVIEEEPFAIIWPVPTYGAVFDFWASQGVISLGGWHHDNAFFAGRRPFRWDVFMDGTRSAEFIAEYYCKKMAGRPATHTGQVIHPSIGARGQVPRRLGVLVPDTDQTMPTGQRVVELVRNCAPNDPEPVLVGYDQDIERGTQQASANTQKFIQEKVTTIVCMCDPIAPVFRTNNMTRNGYFPEFLLPGLGLLDFDKLGRLYDPQQMAHAFGPSHLQVQPPHSDSDASRVWRAAGHSGDACLSCNLPWSYYGLIGTMIQVAGPNLTPWTVEQGMLSLPDRGGWAESGGDPTKVLFRFGPDDYTGISDIKIVYWEESAISTIDGRPGAYVPLDGGRRYVAGELDDQLRVPVDPR